MALFVLGFSLLSTLEILTFLCKGIISSNRRSWKLNTLWLKMSWGLLTSSWQQPQRGWHGRMTAGATSRGWGRPRPSWNTELSAHRKTWRWSSRPWGAGPGACCLPGESTDERQPSPWRTRVICLQKNTS